MERNFPKKEVVILQIITILSGGDAENRIKE